MKCKTNDSWIRYLLKNEQRIRNRIELYLLTDNEGKEESLGVKTNGSGNSEENKLIKKLTNKDYVFRCECLKCLEELYSEQDKVVQEMWILHYKAGYSVERVGYEIGYSRASVYRYLKEVKDELKKRVLEIEKRIYQNADKFDLQM